MVYSSGFIYNFVINAFKYFSMTSFFLQRTVCRNQQVMDGIVTYKMT